MASETPETAELLSAARNLERLAWQQWFQLLRNCNPEDVLEIEDLFCRGVRGELNRIAGHVLREFRMETARFFNDAESVVHTEFTTMLRQVRTGDLDKALSFPAVLKHRSSKAFSAFLHTECGLNPASGMNGMRRRRDAIYQTRLAMSQVLGHEPTDDEVQVATNKRMLEARVDAQKQGMVVSKNDFNPIPSPVSYDPALGVDPTASLSGDDATAIDSSMRKTLARKVLAHHAANESGVASMVAKFLWESQLLDCPPPPPLARDLRTQFPALEQRTITCLYAKLMRDVPRQLLADEFGVKSG